MEASPFAMWQVVRAERPTDISALSVIDMIVSGTEAPPRQKSVGDSVETGDVPSGRDVHCMVGMHRAVKL